MVGARFRSSLRHLIRRSPRSCGPGTALALAPGCIGGRCSSTSQEWDSSDRVVSSAGTSAGTERGGSPRPDRPADCSTNLAVLTGRIMRAGTARSVIVLVAAVAVTTLYAAPPGCGGPVHVPSCCKRHCPDHDASGERTPCCGVPRDAAYPATATSQRVPDTALILAPPRLAVASILRPLLATLARAPDQRHVPIFLELLTLRR